MNIPVVDTHHHIWRFARTPWLNGPVLPRIFGAYEPLRRDYSIEDFAADARPHHVTRSVYVQVNVAPGDEVEEVEWAAAEGKREGLVQAVVGFADMTAADVAVTLDRQLRSSGFRGVRQQLHWHENPAFRFAQSPDVMSSPAFRRGFRELERRGLLFELQVFPQQYELAIDLIDLFPGVQFVLLHAGMPMDMSEAGLQFWRNGLRSFAKRPNVWVKLSGFGTFVRRCEIGHWQPLILDTVAIFGPARCMFGSNYPIESLWTDYGTLMDVFQRSISGLSVAERQLILSGVASDLYRI